MILKFICWLFGHKVLYKAFTGNTITYDGVFDRDIKSPTFVLERSPYCLRCGKSTDAEKKKSRWPSYCRMCMRRDGKDPYKETECLKSNDCEHYPFRDKYIPPPD